MEENQTINFDPKDPAFAEQERFLEAIPPAEFDPLLSLREDLIHISDSKPEYIEHIVPVLYERINSLRLVFPFDWFAWQEGLKDLSSPDFNFQIATLLELSMYLTLIIRGDRFNDGLLENYLRNGTIVQILNRLENIIRDKAKQDVSSIQTRSLD